MDARPDMVMGLWFKGQAVTDCGKGLVAVLTWQDTCIWYNIVIGSKIASHLARVI